MRRIGFMEPIEFVSGKWTPVSVKSPRYAQDAVAGNYSRANMSDVSLFISNLRVRMGNKGKISNRLYYSIKTYHKVGNTAMAQAARDRFKGIAALVRTVFATPEQLATFTAQWRASSVNQTLRKFIWDAQAAIYDSQQNP